MLTSRLLGAALAAALCSSGAFAQVSPAPTPLPRPAGDSGQSSRAATSAAAATVAGEWNAAMETPGGTSSFQIVFQVHGDTLGGTVKRARGDVPLGGTVKGDVVDFSYSIDYNGNPFTISVRATVSGDTMTGTVDLGGNAEEPFTAKRVAAGARPWTSLSAR